ncbi:transglutaminase domain-containing protein [Herbivorax sp. ANBcel31]|uniref:transglutaminase-like domain-containing protein n=1 Tax=Herbivorax sp. ANBcel31 TaxID=3069754 RepID=UPI0027B7FC33|nr:transglutaminase domain-containing protein [Herbivorax sp. ANBcel31]MDQ2087128.1 transglutaminase domain-containing protein [Herbivorax sp. ANBcel31]
MKKSIKVFAMLCIVVTMFVNVVFATGTYTPGFMRIRNVTLQNIPSEVDGKVTFSGSTDNEKIKILIVKDERQRWYDVDLEDGDFHEEIWLIDGIGNYTVSVLVHVEDRRYAYGPTVKVENITEVNRFTVPTLHVESNHEDIIELANEITKDSETDMEKAQSIHNWVSSNITYDYEKYELQKEGHFDNDYGALHTFRTGTGVCYDYSNLVAALGRAVNLQVKVIKGNYTSPSRSELHAWNEIYVSEEDRWILLDSTFASSRRSFFDTSEHFIYHEKIEAY